MKILASDFDETIFIADDLEKTRNNIEALETVLLEEEDIKNIVSLLEKENYNYYLDDGYNQTNNYKDCVKIVVNCIEEDEKNKIIQLIREKIEVHIYASRYHVNIINKYVNKEQALKKLLNIEELDQNSLYVIGDNDNDYEMIKAFNGVIMKEHHPILDELKKNEYESLKDYIEELMKKKKIK